jgi:hypothetical protein
MKIGPYLIEKNAVNAMTLQLARENRFRAHPGVYAIELLLVFLKKTV